MNKECTVVNFKSVEVLISATYIKLYQQEQDMLIDNVSSVPLHIFIIALPVVCFLPRVVELMHGKGVDDSGFGGGPGGGSSGCDGEGVSITQVSTVAGGSTHTTTTRGLHTPS